MHEESLIRSLLRQVEELAQQHHARAVDEIEVEVGPLSGVEPLLLQDAFERLKDEFYWPRAELSVLQVGLDVLCQSCQSESQLKDFRFVCHQCGSTSLKIIRGDAFRLLNVSMQVDDSFNGKPQATATQHSTDACGLPLNEQTSHP